MREKKAIQKMSELISAICDFLMQRDLTIERVGGKYVHHSPNTRASQVAVREKLDETLDILVDLVALFPNQKRLDEIFREAEEKGEDDED